MFLIMHCLSFVETGRNLTKASSHYCWDSFKLQQETTIMVVHVQKYQLGIDCCVIAACVSGHLVAERQKERLRQRGHARTMLNVDERIIESTA